MQGLWHVQALNWFPDWLQLQIIGLEDANKLVVGTVSGNT